MKSSMSFNGLHGAEWVVQESPKSGWSFRAEAPLKKGARDVVKRVLDDRKDGRRKNCFDPNCYTWDHPSWYTSSFSSI